MFVQETENVIDPSARADAVLSHCLPKQVKNFAATELDALNQAHDHPHVGQHRRLRQARLVEHHPFQSQRDRRGAAGGRVRRRRLWGGRLMPTTIETLLLAFSGGRSIVRGTPLTGLLPAMVPSTAEWTTQIPPTDVPRMREKANPAVRAVSNAAEKLGVGLQNRVQRRLILPDKRLGAVILVPIRAKREKLLDGYSKKTRLSVMIPIVVDTPSSYLLDANASRGRARFFVRAGQQLATTARTNDPLCIVRPDYSACRADTASLGVKVRF